MKQAPFTDNRSGPILHKCLAIAIIAGLTCMSPSAADTVVLKNGGLEEAEHTWISDKYVHFILMGTKSVEVRYSKAIVERIIRDGISIPIETEPSIPVSDPSEPDHHATQDLSSEKNQTDRVLAAIPPPAASFLAAVKGIGFYDPHRKEKYWAAPDSRYFDLQSALKALAARYNRSVEWVTANMGEENDLAVIHQRLYSQLTRAAGSAEPDHAEESLQHPGPSATEPPKVTPQSPEMIPISNEFRGLKFYDPRRGQKYWIDNHSRYDTLQDAINGLAALYGVTPEWIAAQIGESNQLDQIHLNIRKNLGNP